MMQQTQGVQIKGRDSDPFATLTADGSHQRLDTNTLLVGTDGSTVTITGGKLDVNSSAPVGGATEAKQDSTSLAASEQNLLLRKILKVLESNSIVDYKQRQKVIIDAVGTTVATGLATEVTTTLPIAGTVTLGAVTSPASLGTSLAAGGQGPTLSLPTLATTVYQPTWEGPVDQRWRVMEDSHISYQLGIRNNLAFS